MNDLPDPRAIIFAVLAVYFAILIGVPLADARNAVVFPLMEDCVPVLFGDLVAIPLITHLVTCGLGVFIFVVIPGAVGVGLAVFQSR